MKIFSTTQVKQWDAYTIANEPVSSINLMERAATACFTWLANNFENPGTYIVFCGTGNNGGDGLAIARMLLQAGDTVSIYILEGGNRSADFSVNLAAAQLKAARIHFINKADFPDIPVRAIVIDAMFGSGLSRPLEGVAAEVVDYINRVSKRVISIDIPTGLFADSSSKGNAIIRASHTLSFQTCKPAFLMGENNQYTGTVHLLDIGLHPHFYNEEPALFNMLELEDIRLIFKPRNQFSHKYNFGHALLYAGSRDMMGAAILCARACLRSGAGLVTVITEAGTQPVIQTALPEAITATGNDFETLSEKKSVIGTGPGLALSETNKNLLKKIITGFAGPLVIDASALQMLSPGEGILKERKPGSAILTPHTGEFEKLFGKTANDFERVKTAVQRSADLGCYIVLKGHHTLIACPDGNAFFNTTGNAGMATAGSGDVLTGMLTGLLSQGYSPKNACLLGVYLHGMAGDIAAERMSQEAMIAGDIIEGIGEAFKKITISRKDKLFEE